MLLVQAVPLQSWLLDRLLAFAAKVTLLQGLQADKGAHFTPEQVAYFSQAIPAAVSQARSQLEVGGGRMDYSILFGMDRCHITEVKVPPLAVLPSSLRLHHQSHMGSSESRS